ncbi:hypothetical protein Vqi01_26130 [Micromonospora qiuiae]|uniref:Glycosyltransferase RgtA/B/C/D-like domain-containing protein n=2 Tax=Micromonospora qiuiae TaxID=502268 RepID=A0ABQ4JBA4_9ACTN|nr:hypothetical protein Vqi01_26130 [Micromonospora qiuiae]
MRRLLARVPAPWPYVLIVFVGTKIILSLVGVLALAAFDAIHWAPPPDDLTRHQQRDISPHRWLSLWFAWDSFLYDHLARLPLDEPWREFAFPLLYPFLARPLAPLLGGDTALALLVVANAAFLGVLYYAYRLGERLLITATGQDAAGQDAAGRDAAGQDAAGQDAAGQDAAGRDAAGHGQAARRFVRYLVLLPTAFLFHAALTESLFLCLALATFYYAEKRRWLLVGVVGFFLALSRSAGFFVALPLALVLLGQGGYRLGPRALRGYLRSGWPLVLLPAGWLTFMAFCRWQGGDWFAYKHAQEQGWNIRVQNPLGVLWGGLTGAAPDAARVWVAVGVLAVLVAGTRRLGLPYLVYGLMMVLVPLSMGQPVYKSLLRYLLAVFPVALVLAGWARRPMVDVWLTAALALLQGALFVVWLAYWTRFII